jgi:hypothetical protein
MTTNTQVNTPIAVCIQNTDAVASLEVRKIYQILPDEDAQKHNLVRVIDESGDDYLYPTSYFLIIDVPQSVKEAVLKAA